MSDAGNENGGQVDSPTVNAHVVGVDITAEGTSPEVPEAEPGAEWYAPGDYTVAEVEAYVDAHPDELDDVLAAEREGKARATLLSALEARTVDASEA
jgi:hypothetical protein